MARTTHVSNEFPWWIADSLIYKSPRYFLPSFESYWSFEPLEQEQNRFSRWRPSWIFDRNNLSFVLSTSQFDTSYLVSSQILLNKGKIDFQDGDYDGHFGFPVGRSLVNFNLHVALILPTKFGVILAFHFRKRRAKTIFKMVDQKELSYFLSSIRPDNSAGFETSGLLVQG